MPVDLPWVDEDPGDDDRIYNELLGRTISTSGRIIVSLTPMLGLTPIRKRFIDASNPAKIFQVRGGIEKALHIPEARRAAIIASIPERERAARVHGLEQQGEGAVFTIPVEQIIFDRSPQTFPEYWPIINACDFSHGGQVASAHPMAVASAAYDKSTDTIYIFDAYTMKQMLPEAHVWANAKRRPSAPAFQSAKKCCALRSPISTLTPSGMNGATSSLASAPPCLPRMGNAIRRKGSRSNGRAANSTAWPLHG